MKIHSISKTNFKMIYKSNKYLPQNVKDRFVNMVNKPKALAAFDKTAKEVQRFFPDRTRNESVATTHEAINYKDYFLSGYNAIKYEELKQKYSEDEFQVIFEEELADPNFPPTLINIDYDEKTGKILGANLTF